MGFYWPKVVEAVSVSVHCKVIIDGCRLGGGGVQVTCERGAGHSKQFTA